MDHQIWEGGDQNKKNILVNQPVTKCSSIGCKHVTGVKPHLMNRLLQAQMSEIMLYFERCSINL